MCLTTALDNAGLPYRNRQRKRRRGAAIVKYVYPIVPPIRHVGRTGFLVTKNDAAVTRAHCCRKILSGIGRQNEFPLTVPRYCRCDRCRCPATCKANPRLAETLKSRKS